MQIQPPDKRLGSMMSPVRTRPGALVGLAVLIAACQSPETVANLRTLRMDVRVQAD